MNDYCDREDWLAAYLDRTIAEGERVRIEEHLAKCSRCLSELIAAKTELDDIDEAFHGPRSGLSRSPIILLPLRISASLSASIGRRGMGGPAFLHIVYRSIPAALSLLIGISLLCLIDTRVYCPDYKEAVYMLQNIISASRIGPLRLSDGRREPPSAPNTLRSGGNMHRITTVRIERKLQRALNRYPADHAILVALGHLYIASGQPERAETYYENALLLKPGDPRIINNVAVAAYRRGDPCRALALLLQVERTFDVPPEILYNIAILYGESGDRQLQRKYLGSFLDIDGTSPWAERARELAAD
jgi:tetratricopeptide (TPR) repeat protein